MVRYGTRNVQLHSWRKEGSSPKPVPLSLGVVEMFETNPSPSQLMFFLVRGTLDTRVRPEAPFFQLVGV